MAQVKEVKLNARSCARNRRKTRAPRADITYLTDSAIFFRLLEMAIRNSCALFGQSASSFSAISPAIPLVRAGEASHGEASTMPHNNGFRRPAYHCWVPRVSTGFESHEELALQREFRVRLEDGAWSASRQLHVAARVPPAS